MNKVDRELRSGMMLAQKLRGQTIQQIQEEFRVSKATAYRQMAKARKSGMLVQANDYITENLVPKALAAYDHILTSSDDLHLVKEVADKVLEGLGILGRHSTVNVNTSNEPTESFEEFRAVVTRRVVAAAITQSPSLASLAEGESDAGDEFIPEDLVVSTVDAPRGQPDAGPSSVPGEGLHLLDAEVK